MKINLYHNGIERMNIKITTTSKEKMQKYALNLI